jgi:ankyrin repeat protein
MLEPLSTSLSFEQCVRALAEALKADVLPQTNEERLLLVHYFVALVIEGHLPAHSHDGLGNTALHYAARVGWAAGVGSIMDCFALNDSEWDYGRSYDAVKQMQKGGASAAALRRNAIGCSPLHCACVSGCSRTLHVLLQAASDTVHSEGVSDEGEEAVEEFFGRDHVDNDKRTLLHYTGAISPEQAAQPALDSKSNTVFLLQLLPTMSGCVQSQSIFSMHPQLLGMRILSPRLTLP